MLVTTAALAACDATSTAPMPDPASEPLARAAEAAGALVFDAERTPLQGDLAHYTFSLRGFDASGEEIRVHRVVRERAPWIPRAGHDAAMMLHGDFSTFVTNFLPEGGGLAGYLAERGVDVWGVDHRWATAPADSDLAGFADMGLTQEIGDIRGALAFARATRAATGAGASRLKLVGFSHGGQIAYAVASVEAAEPPWRRHVDGLVPLDIAYAYAPEDDALRQSACDNAAIERQLLEGGVVDADNSFLIAVGEGALSTPDDPSPFFHGATYRGAFLKTVAQTYVFAPYTPLYHLASGVIEDGAAVALRDSPEPLVETWLADATPHQSMREAAELDALWCGDAPLPIDAPIERIAIPVFYLGAAGGFGDHGVYSTTRVASTDVTVRVVRRLDPSREAEDFGHADLLFADDAPALAWQELAAWIHAH